MNEIMTDKNNLLYHRIKSVLEKARQNISHTVNITVVHACFPNRHTLCDQLSWSHYRQLIRISDDGTRCQKAKIRLLQQNTYPICLR